MGTTISGQTHVTPPVPRTTRVPISGSKTALAPEVAATWSPVTVTLSGMGIVSDATNGLAYHAAPPAGATGQEVAINAGIAAAWAASGGAGLRIIWDVAVAIGAPIYYPGSNTEIIAPSKACGAILRTAANCPIMRAPGTNANMTISTNTQNTFGKFDPSIRPGPPSPSASGNYRVFDPAFVNAQNLALRGGTWNHAASYQSANASTPYGIISAFQFWGVDGLKIYDVDVLDGIQYHIHILNFRNCEYGNILIDGNPSLGSDGVHFNGPGIGVHGGHLKTCCGDDNLAFNMDDGPASGVLVPGINIQCGGDCVNVDVEGPELWIGSGNFISLGALRLSSTYHRIDNFIIRNSLGQFQNSQYRLDQSNVGLCPGNGNYGHVILDGVYADGSGAGYTVMHISGVWEFLEIRGRYRYNAQPNTDIQIDGANIAKLHIEWDGYQPAGAANNTQPAVVFNQECHVKEMIMKATMAADATISPRAAPFIRTAFLTDITRLELHAQGDAITNLVDHVAGSIGTLILTGIHSNSGGGSPLAIASGATLTNYCYSAAGGALAYKSGSIAAYSGTGTPTNSNVYSGP